MDSAMRWIRSCAFGDGLFPPTTKKLQIAGDDLDRTTLDSITTVKGPVLKQAFPMLACRSSASRVVVLIAFTGPFSQSFGRSG